MIWEKFVVVASSSTQPPRTRTNAWRLEATTTASQLSLPRPKVDPPSEPGRSYALAMLAGEPQSTANTPSYISLSSGCVRTVRSICSVVDEAMSPDEVRPSQGLVTSSTTILLGNRTVIHRTILSSVAEKEWVSSSDGPILSQVWATTYFCCQCLGTLTFTTSTARIYLCQVVRRQT